MGEQTDLSVKSQEQLSSKRVFVEVGMGYSTTSASRRIKPVEKRIYIGVEIDSKDAKKFRDELESEGKSDKTFVVNADATKMPMLDKSVDELFFKNVFGDPKLTNRNDYEWSEIRVRPFFQEALRVLKSKGALTILETYTAFSSDKLTEFLEKNGFHVDKITYADDPNWIEAVQEYDSRSVANGMNDERNRPYLLHASPDIKD